VAASPPRELVKLRRNGLIIVNEVGHIPVEQDPANLFFEPVMMLGARALMMLRAGLVDTDLEPALRRPGNVLRGDQVVGSAIIDLIVHPAKVITFKGSDYRLKHTQVDSLASTRRENPAVDQLQSGSLPSQQMAHFSTIADSWRDEVKMNDRISLVQLS